ncbi:MAG: hypothetical protein IJ042_05950 [Butyricicoccus sp.]|nr:hypothetical protein [Butyricicoccus sp.]
MHDEMCFSTHTGDSPACCDFLDAARYHEIMQAEREGRLWITPLKVGDVVWIKKHRFPAEIENICLDKDGFCFEYVEYERSPEVTELWDNGCFAIEEIGKTVFLSREEAEKALEEAK